MAKEMPSILMGLFIMENSTMGKLKTVMHL